MEGRSWHGSIWLVHPKFFSSNEGNDNLVLLSLGLRKCIFQGGKLILNKSYKVDNFASARKVCSLGLLTWTAFSNKSKVNCQTFYQLSPQEGKLFNETTYLSINCFSFSPLRHEPVLKSNLMIFNKLTK